jgi:YggT family protein
MRMCPSPCTARGATLGCGPRGERGHGMYSLLNLIDIILNLYKWCLIIYVILSWLISFNVLNTYNRLVFTANDFLYKITEPALRSIRKVIPSIGGIDISPIILILIIHFVQNLLHEYGM